MKPNDTYSYIKNNHLNPDWMSLMKCYQPIIGLDGLGLYQYLWAHYDNGQEIYKLSRILNHLNMGMQRLEHGLYVLNALKLVDTYQEEDRLLLQLLPPLSVESFLDHSLYKTLLSRKIGDEMVGEIQAVVLSQEKNISKSFSEVFDLQGQTYVKLPDFQEFDLYNFKQQMARNHLRFENEEEAVIALYHLAEQRGWTWFQAFKVAQETAIQSLDQTPSVISIKRMEAYVEKVEQPSVSASEREANAIRNAKAYTPMEFLRLYKQSLGATDLYDERVCIQDMEKLGLLGEVINMILLRSFRKDSANLNTRYARKIANDMAAKQVRTAEQALAYLKEFDVQRGGISRKSQSAPANSASNVPDWSKQEVNTEQTAEGQAQLADLYRQFEEMENKGGGL